MAIIITDGKQYIKYNFGENYSKFKIVIERERATEFRNCSYAIKAFRKYERTLKDFYVYDEEDQNICYRHITRRTWSQTARKVIYNQADGCCQLCGRKIDYCEMTLDHIYPLSMGGKDEMENLQCTCKTCNEFKDNILPDQFLNRVTEIFLYQMKKKCNNDWIWNVTERLIKKRLKTME